VEIPEDVYLPPLPFRMNDKLMFPVGRFRAKWDTAELTALAEVGGRITKVHRQVWYDVEPIFVDFVQQLFAYRDKKSPFYEQGMAFIAKIILNSTFGKLGIREARQRILVAPRGRVPNFLEFFDMESDTYITDETYRAPYLAPAIPAHITSLARIRLWRHNMAVLKAGGRLFYNDTDSLTAWLPDGKRPNDVLPISGKLGDLKLEHDKIRLAQYTMPKLYLFDCESPEEGHERPPKPTDCLCYHDWWKGRAHGEHWMSTEIKAKGLGPGLGSDELTVDEFRRFSDPCLPESQRTIIRKRMGKLRESQAAFARKVKDFPFVVNQTKVLRGVYDKRRICADGVETTPLIVNGAVERGEPTPEELGLPF